MAGNSQGSKLPTNEELIEELIKGNEDFLVTDKDKVNSSKSVDCKPVANKLNGDIHKRGEGFDEESSDTNKDSVATDDFIDDVALKDAELLYTEEDKKRLNEEALQLKLRGNKFFHAGEFQESAQKYTLALRTCPLAFPSDRAALFCNRAACKMKLGLHKSGVEDCTEAINLKADYVKAYIRRAQMYERLEKLDEALADYKEILKLDPGNKDAYTATVRLPHEINERNEKLKTEMFGKLKELGNMVLKPFGLSTDNFKVNQDPNSGGYTVNFQQNSE